MSVERAWRQRLATQQMFRMLPQQPYKAAVDMHYGISPAVGSRAVNQLDLKKSWGMPVAFSNSIPMPGHMTCPAGFQALKDVL